MDPPRESAAACSYVTATPARGQGADAFAMGGEVGSPPHPSPLPQGERGQAVPAERAFPLPSASACGCGHSKWQTRLGELARERDKGGTLEAIDRIWYNTLERLFFSFPKGDGQKAELSATIIAH